MSNNLQTIEIDSSKQQEFNLLSIQQKIQKGLGYTRDLVFGSLSFQDQDFIISDDLQSFTLQNLEVSPFPTESRKVMKFIPTDLIQKFLDINNFIQVNDYSVVFANIDDLSYHNFENILNLDHLFDHINFNLKNITLINKKVQIFEIQGSTDTLLSLDRLNYYTIPLNSSQRGGKRLIFHSNQLSFQLTKMINESDLFDKKNFRFVNTIFRLNNFAPGDKKFKSHYDTPYADKSNSLYSKYTMLIYLTGNNNSQNELSPLQIEDIVLDQIKENSCIIFDQQLKHEGNAYSDKNKIFIRTELIYEMDDLGYDEKVASMFNMACYMTKEIGQEQYSADLFNKCVKMRYNIQDNQEEYIKRVFLLKRNLEILYITDGNYYWFPLHVPLNLIGVMIVLDYFNGKVYDLKNVKIQSKVIDIKFNQSEEEADKYVFDFINSCSFEEETILLDRIDHFKCLNSYIPDNLCEDYAYFTCECGMGEDLQAKQLFDDEKVAAVENLNKILNQNGVLIFDQQIKINYENIKIETDNDNNNNSNINGLVQGRIILSESNLNLKNSINFASCQCDGGDLCELDVLLFKKKQFNVFALPKIKFQKQKEGIKLQIDIFKNGFIYQSKQTFKQPYTNYQESFEEKERDKVIEEDLDLEEEF